jgi:predicted transcriptional regulator
MVDSLNRREREIMDCAYSRRRASATEIQAMLGDGTSNSAVRTMLGILEEKGYLRHEQEGKRFVYIPVKAPEDAGREALKRAVNTFFGNSAKEAIAALIESEGSALSDEDFIRLTAMIETARRGGR